MPVVAVGAAIWAGAEIATVGIAAMSTFEVIGAIGAIAGGVGAITGDKTLMQVGMVMGAVGGVGALASNAGLIGGTASGADAAGVTAGDVPMASATSATGDVADVSAVGSGAAATPADAAQAAASAGDVPMASATSATDAAPAASTPAAAPGSADFLNSEAANPAPAAAPSASYGDENVIGAVSNSTAAAAPNATDPAGILNRNLSPQAYDTASGNYNAGPTASDMGTSKGGVFSSLTNIGGKILDTLNGNKGLANIVGQMATGALAGLNPKNQAETQYDQSMTALNNQRLAAMSAPQPALYTSGALRPAVFGAPGAAAPVYQQPVPAAVTGSVTAPGILNAGRVTGSVA